MKRLRHAQRGPGPTDCDKFALAHWLNLPDRRCVHCRSASLTVHIMSLLRYQIAEETDDE